MTDAELGGLGARCRSPRRSLRGRQGLAPVRRRVQCRRPRARTSSGSGTTGNRPTGRSRSLAVRKASARSRRLGSRSMPMRSERSAVWITRAEPATARDHIALLRGRPRARRQAASPATTASSTISSTWTPATGSDHRIASIDTVLLLGGILFAAQYTTAPIPPRPKSAACPRHQRPRRWRGCSARGRFLDGVEPRKGLHPHQGTATRSDLLYLLALGVPTHASDANVGPDIRARSASAGANAGVSSTSSSRRISGTNTAMSGPISAASATPGCATMISTCSKTAAARPARSAITRSPIRNIGAAMTARCGA